MNNKKIIFVVGNSRSGTHLVSNILGNHEEVFTFPHEIHFFEELWSPSDEINPLTKENAIRLLARLLCIDSDGYLTQKNPSFYYDEARSVIVSLDQKTFTPHSIFELFLFHATERQGRSVPCEHTPRNLFYVREIMKFYPQAIIINMIRDPRDILLSQKRKWRRRFLGAKQNIPLRESLRAWINYNPITICRLWNSSMSVAERNKLNTRFISIRFEDLIGYPEESVKQLCAMIGLPYSENLLDVPHTGSSSEVDDRSCRGIRRRGESWQKGGLNSAEIYLCNRICGSLMEKYSYHPLNITPQLYALIYYFLAFPIKLCGAFILNFRRAKNFRVAFLRRFGTSQS